MKAFRNVLWGALAIGILMVVSIAFWNEVLTNGLS